MARSPEALLSLARNIPRLTRGLASTVREGVTAHVARRAAQAPTLVQARETLQTGGPFPGTVDPNLPAAKAALTNVHEREQASIKAKVLDAGVGMAKQLRSDIMKATNNEVVVEDPTDLMDRDALDRWYKDTAAAYLKWMGGASAEKVAGIRTPKGKPSPKPRPRGRKFDWEHLSEFGAQVAQRWFANEAGVLRKRKPDLLKAGAYLALPKEERLFLLDQLNKYVRGDIIRQEIAAALAGK